jgi:hypothetical protein
MGITTAITYVSEEVRGENVVKMATKPYKPWVRSIDMANMLNENLFPPIAFVYRRDIYDGIGGYDETLPVLGDWDFHLRFLLQADIGFINEKLANYHHRDRTQKASTYANSITGGIDKHTEYNAILRNRYFRESIKNHDSFGAMIATAYMLNGVTASGGGSVGGAGSLPDDIDYLKQDPHWVAEQVPWRAAIIGMIYKIRNKFL